MNTASEYSTRTCLAEKSPKDNKSKSNHTVTIISL